MERIDLIEYEQAGPEVKASFDSIQEASGGHVMNVFKVLANQPKVLEGISELIFGVYRSGEVDIQLTELAYLYTSTLHKCHY